MPRAIANILATARWLRSRRYDRAYVLKRSFSSALVCALARIPHRVGFASEGRGLLFSRAVRIDETRHEAELFLDLLRADGIEVDDGHNENWVAAEAVRSVARSLPEKHGPRVFVAPCSTNPSKQWPLDRFASAIAAIVQARDADIFLCGGPADRRTHATLLAMVGPKVAGRIHDFSDAFGLRETAALLSRMDLCVGIDTGLVHLAASFGVPVVAIFGPMDPARWGPWKTPHALVRASRSCSPCNLRVPCPINDVCMRDIDIRDVVAAVDGLLASRGGLPDAADVRSIDLTQGERVYEITFSPPAKDAVADEPATKPLAQAH
jgi:heptosyltransferase-2